MKSLDKKKTKELDLKEQWLIHIYKNVDSDANENIKKLIRQIALDDWKFINSLLTQQRTELLEEIRELIDSCYWIVGTNYVVNGKQEKMISKSEIIEKFTNLLNKKNE